MITCDHDRTDTCSFGCCNRFLHFRAGRVDHREHADKDQILFQQTVRRMFQKELDLDPRMFGFPLEEGLGVFLQGSGKDFSFLHPGGNDPGATSWLVGYPELGKGAVIMTNGAKGDLLSLEILPALAKTYGWPPAR